MSKKGVIIIIEDDQDDKEFFEMIIRDLGYSNKIKWFRLTDDACEYLKESSDPTFVIFCDVNLPRVNGLEFKKNIEKDPQLRKKSIPFIFFSTSSNQQYIDKAYSEMNVQGYFVKGNNLNESREIIRIILEYWKACRHPNAD